MITSTAIIYDSIFLKHDYPGHPENAKRLKSIYDELESKNLFNEIDLLDLRDASEKELLLCHSKDYIDKLKKFCENGGGFLDPDTYANDFSYQAAIRAVGGLLELTKKIINREYKNGFALLRPPGHHALKNRSMGFCLFGNVAIAAKYSLKFNDIKRVAIVDFDVHHGNGTQAMVGDDPSILYISTHQYPFYPGTGSINEIGERKAKGTILNIPLSAGTGDKSFKRLYQEIIIPVIERFEPDLILVSAGFDAHWKDPLANLGLSLTGYNFIINELINCANLVCNGKIIFALEGGYNLDVLRKGVANTINTLLGKNDFDDPFGKESNSEPSVDYLIIQLKKLHQI